MPQRLLKLPRAALGAIAFALAGLLMFAIAFFSALIIESRTDSVVSEKLREANMDWVSVATDGMQVGLTGMAPNEAARFRALNLVGSLVDSSRIRDGLEVAPTTAIEAPRFTVEMLRNDDGIQLIGLIPAQNAEGALDSDGLTEAANAMTPADARATNMLQTANWPAPANWDASLRFGLDALSLLKRSKISVSAGEVRVTAIADSPAEKRRFEAELNKRKPADMRLETAISAPRPVITPFTLRFVVDAGGARFDACSADTDRARGQILAAAAAAGMEGPAICTVGLGTPTPRWAEGAALAIRTLGTMGHGVVTFSDADITFEAGEGVTQAAFDTAIGDLRAGLPDVFSLTPVPPAQDAAIRGPAEFTARLTASGRVELRGRLVDEAQQSAVDAFARASFTAGDVYVGTVLDAELPDGWPVRVLAGLDSLSMLAEGTLVVRADTVELRGVTGNQEARARITQILSSELGQGQNFRVEVTYDKKLDPLAALPTPRECAADVARIMAKGKINFTAGSAEIASEAGPIIGEIAEVLKLCPAIAMEIGGHTDSQGSESGNAALSQARAEAVLMALQGRRIDTSNMTAVGYGESTPIADNGTEAGREANRRIEFRLIGADAETAQAAPTQAAPETAPADEATAEATVAEEAGADTTSAAEAETDADTPQDGDAAASDTTASEAGAEDAAPAEAAEGGADGSAASAETPAPNAANLNAAAPDAAAPTAGETEGAVVFTYDGPSLAPTEMTPRPRTRPASSTAE
ncbi:OmpA family protein [Xinfangfangia sp. D13-10-4-6]|uniref:OmpA family protein n=1 Tax=Pseudogemmobacter hezensis TaxID=2737662 RepID=UPI001556C124|nr:OmpA family protein [Pseudogemmobacter hezensis]NPD14648.1 OmpA family protein [Pseudogemmobacter hezensis]